MFAMIVVVSAWKVVVTATVSAGIGFGFGVVKSVQTRAAIDLELGKIENYTSSEARGLYAAIKRHL